MYARSSTFQARPGSMDEGIAYVRNEVMTAATALEGFVGLSMICDGDQERCIATSAWSTEEAMSGSEQVMAPLRQRGAAIFGGEPSVDRWEIAVLHRQAPSRAGSSVRCTWLSMSTAAIGHAIETYRLATLPALEVIDGFRSASMMVDRRTGRVVSSVTFDSRDAMVASRLAAETIRSRTAEDVGAKVTDIHEFELAIAHLHVPEIA